MEGHTMAANAILEGYTADFTARVHFARRHDGQWFRRMQHRTFRGYRWSAWRPSPAPTGRLMETGNQARLPKAAA